MKKYPRQHANAIQTLAATAMSVRLSCMFKDIIIVAQQQVRNNTDIMLMAIADGFDFSCF